MGRLKGNEMGMLGISERILIGVGHVIFLIFIKRLFSHPRRLSDSKIANKLHPASFRLNTLNLMIQFFLIRLNGLIIMFLFKYSTLGFSD